MNNSKQHFWTHKPIEVIEQEERRLSECLRNTFPRDISEIGKIEGNKARIYREDKQNEETGKLRWYGTDEYYIHKRVIPPSDLYEKLVEDDRNIKKLLNLSNQSVNNIEESLKEGKEVKKENDFNLLELEEDLKNKKYKIEPIEPYFPDPFYQLCEKNKEEIPDYFWDYNDERLYKNHEKQYKIH